MLVVARMLALSKISQQQNHTGTNLLLMQIDCKEIDES